MKKLASAAVATALCTFAWSSQAQETKLGDAGTLAIVAATGSPMLASSLTELQVGATPTLGFQTVTHSDREVCNGNRCETERRRVTSFYINPRLHYFVIENLSIGGEVLFATFSGTRIRERTNPNETSETDLIAPTGFGLMPMVGYNIRLGDRFSIWPQGGIGFRRFSYTDENNVNDPNDDVDFGENWWFLNVDVPFILHITPHLSLGAGPGATFTLSRSLSTTVGPRTDTLSGYSTTMLRWFNAHLIGYF